MSTFTAKYSRCCQEDNFTYIIETLKS